MNQTNPDSASSFLEASDWHRPTVAKINAADQPPRHVRGYLLRRRRAVLSRHLFRGLRRPAKEWKRKLGGRERVKWTQFLGPGAKLESGRFV
jgi:hypothetical protein